LVLAEQPQLEPAIQGWALTVAGDLAYRQGAYAEAESLQTASLRLFQGLGDREGMAASTMGLGNVAQCEGRHDRAAALFAECLHLRRALGDQRGIAGALENLGEAVLARGDAGRAASLFEESLTLARSDLLREASVLNGLGLLASHGAEWDRAAEWFRRSLIVEREIGDRWGSYFNLQGLAVSAVALGALAHGARLLGVLERLRAVYSVPLDRNHLDLHRKAVATLNTAMPPEARTAAWDWGRALTLDAAVDYALSPTLDHGLRVGCPP
ncbi:MAG TPA: tetratricopeptide repeat protein, partial [Chloroflexota bacterium]|nr:tetratricopeptide repeat protein [Chloroflexota bacterium]